MVWPVPAISTEEHLDPSLAFWVSAPGADTGAGAVVLVATSAVPAHFDLR